MPFVAIVVILFIIVIIVVVFVHFQCLLQELPSLISLVLVGRRGSFPRSFNGGCLPYILRQRGFTLCLPLLIPSFSFRGQKFGSKVALLDIICRCLPRLSATTRT